jgi:hypothetical protein
VTGQAIKAEGAEPEGQELSPTPLPIIHITGRAGRAGRGNIEIDDVTMWAIYFFMAGQAITVASLAGQAIKAEGAQPEGQELSPSPVPSSTAIAQVDDVMLCQPLSSWLGTQ